MTKREVLDLLVKDAEGLFNFNAKENHTVELRVHNSKSDYFIRSMPLGRMETNSWFVEVWIDDICVHRVDEYDNPVEADDDILDRLYDKLLLSVFAAGIWSEKIQLEKMLTHQP